MNDPHYTDEHPTNPTRVFDTQSFAAQRGSARGQRDCLTPLMAIGGALFAFLMVAAIVSAIVLPSVYRELEPLQQEIWCSRAETVGATFVCDWKPTPPFEVYPTLEGGDSNINPDDLLLTPFDFDNGSATDGTPVSLDGTLQAPPDLATHTPTPSPLPASTAIPTGLPTATLMPTPTLPAATATPIPPPPSAKLVVDNLRAESQRWNNCGPTTLTMGLSYFGYTNNQALAADYLKPNIEDKNVSPWQMVNYVNQTAVNMVGTKAIYRVGGNLTLLKSLLAANFPVIIEKGYEVGDLGWMGHYLLMVGYDDSQQIFYTFDSYLGTGGGNGRQETYEYVDNYWRQFNRTYIVLYTPEREAQLAQILGEFADPTNATLAALEQARADATADPNDKWAWVNMGESLVMLEQYTEAAVAFDRAFQLQLPYRLLWYRFGAFEAYYHVGRYQDVLTLADNVDRSSGYYVEEAWYYRGLAYAAQNNDRQAVTEFQRVLSFNRNFTPATEALNAVQNGTFAPPEIS